MWWTHRRAASAPYRIQVAENFRFPFFVKKREVNLSIPIRVRATTAELARKACVPGPTCVRSWPLSASKMRIGKRKKYEKNSPMAPVPAMHRKAAMEEAIHSTRKRPR
jgi:hypothetical protein